MIGHIKNTCLDVGLERAELHTVMRDSDVLKQIAGDSRASIYSEKEEEIEMSSHWLKEIIITKYIKNWRRQPERYTSYQIDKSAHNLVVNERDFAKGITNPSMKEMSTERPLSNIWLIFSKVFITAVFVVKLYPI